MVVAIIVVFRHGRLILAKKESTKIGDTFSYCFDYYRARQVGVSHATGKHVYEKGMPIKEMEKMKELICMWHGIDCSEVKGFIAEIKF